MSHDTAATHPVRPADLSWRPLTPADIDAWVDLLAAIEAADATGEHVDAEQLAERLENSYIDFPRGSLAAFDRAGAMLAYCYLQARTAAEPVHELRMEGGVHPAHRGLGLGSRLLDWVEQAARPLHEERFPGRPLNIDGNSLSGNVGAEQLFADHGYHQARWFNDMRRDVDGPLPEASLPAGVVVHSFTPERSEDARLIRNEAFRDHWGSTESSPESWAQLTAGSAFRPELTLVAYEAGADGTEGEPLALVLCEEFEAHRRATGRRDLYIALVGTRRIGRKRGLASALLCHVLWQARTEGLESASLGVDADSPTGALGLYERLGFRADQVWAAQLKSLA